MRRKSQIACKKNTRSRTKNNTSVKTQKKKKHHEDDATRTFVAYEKATKVAILAAFGLSSRYLDRLDSWRVFMRRKKIQIARGPRVIMKELKNAISSCSDLLIRMQDTRPRIVRKVSPKNSFQMQKTFYLATNVQARTCFAGC